MLKLCAVDSVTTRVHEDGFSIETLQQDKNYLKIVIASVIPDGLTFNPKSFVENLHKHSWEPKANFFFSPLERERLSLHPTKKQNVIYVRIETVDNLGFSVDIGIDEAVATIYTHESFANDTSQFIRAQKRIESILVTYPEIWKKYQDKCLKISDESRKITEMKALIYGLSLIFNTAMSKACWKNQTPTLRMKDFVAHYDVSQKPARFTGPLRRAEAYVNIYNLAAKIMGKGFISETYLRNIGCFGVVSV